MALSWVTQHQDGDLGLHTARACWVEGYLALLLAVTWLCSEG